MSKNTSILLGEHYDNFVREKVHSGRYSSVSEVIRAALRHLEQAENRSKTLEAELEKGEKSRMISGFDAENFLQGIHKRHLK